MLAGCHSPSSLARTNTSIPDVRRSRPSNLVSKEADIFNKF